MAVNPETRFKFRVVKDLKTLTKTWFFKTNQVALLGIPDFIICTWGRFIAVELKRDRKAKPTKLQLAILRKIERAGGLAMTSSPETWKDDFKTIKNVSKQDQPKQS